MKMIKTFTFISLLIIGMTSSVFASWWNPISWFKKIPSAQKTVTQETKTTINTPTASTTDSQKSEIEILKKEVEELKKNQNTNMAIKKPVAQQINKQTITSTKTTNNTTINNNQLSKEETDKLNQLIKKYNDLQDEQSYAVIHHIGPYSLPEGVSPDQVSSIYDSADRIYENQYANLVPQIIMLKYKYNPSQEKIMLDEFRYGQLRDSISNLNSKLQQVSAKQNSIKDCVDTLSPGYGPGCN